MILLFECQQCKYIKCTINIECEDDHLYYSPKYCPANGLKILLSWTRIKRSNNKLIDAYKDVYKKRTEKKIRETTDVIDEVKEYYNELKKEFDKIKKTLSILKGLNYEEESDK